MCFALSGLIAQPTALHVSGVLTDSVSGNPLPNYPVHIDIDSATGGFFFHHMVMTMPDGSYIENILLNPQNIPSGILKVSVWECNMIILHSDFAFGPSNLSFTKDFQVSLCPPPPPPCHAEFFPAPPPPPPAPPQPLTVHFINTSIGVNGPWLWLFGDGTTSAEFSPFHNYAANGLYNVILKMGDSIAGGCFDTENHEIKVGDSLGNNCKSWFTHIPDWHHIYFEGHIPCNQTANYSWSFGDGTSGNGKNTDHIYVAPGIYTVSLTTVRQDSSQCTFTSTQQLQVWDSTDFHEVYGHVFEGTVPLHWGMAMIFSDDSVAGGLPFFAISPLDSAGMYMFPFVPDGQFVIWALPFDSVGVYLPTFYQHTLFWEQADKITLGQPANPYDIHLMHAIDAPAGQGCVQGHLAGLKSTSTSQIVVLLSDENGQSLGFRKMSTSGTFDFSRLAYGTYYLKPEMPNTSSDNVKVVISATNPVASVTFTYNGKSILGVSEISAVQSFTASPVPVKDVLNLNIRLINALNASAEIYNFTGQRVLNSNLDLNKGENAVQLDLNSLCAGLYTLRITSTDAVRIVQKIIKQ